jgi:hypothetical protein
MKYPRVVMMAGALVLAAWVAAFGGVAGTGRGTGAAQPATVADAAAGGDALVGIDHMPFAVKDLDRAILEFQRLGFAIKPGRLHADGIHNAHVKFPDGAGIELITASEPTDDLTRQYLRFLAAGEGPAFVSFHSASLAELTQHLEKAHFASVVHDGLLEVQDPALEWLFLFAGTNQSPTDRPEHFAHPNTADATLAVWIVGPDEMRMTAFFTGLGARIERKRVFVPDAVLATVATVANGEVVFLPQSRQLIPDHPIVGAVFHVRDFDTAERVLRSGKVRGIRKLQTEAHRSLFVPPQETGGAWLEFRQ